MNTPHILIIEDENELAEILQGYLLKNQYQVTILSSGEHATETILNGEWDLVLLDLMLPRKSGLTICTEVRQVSEIPIIMMTARVEEVDRLVGLRLGADDYICKPYSPREVVARVEAVLRRTQNHGKSHNKVDGLRLDADTLRAHYQGKQIELTVVEFNILQTLSSKPNRIFSRNQLMDKAYNDNRIVNDRTIDSHINKLRKKLQTIVGGEVVRSVYGAGYKFDLINVS